MAHNDVLMINFGEVGDLARRLSEQINADDGEPISIRRIGGDAADATLQSESWAMAWLVSEGPLDEAFFNVLERLSSSQVPTLITRAGERQAAGTVYQSGVVVVPPQTSADAVRLLVRGTLAQAESMTHLRRQLAITQRHHGGLRGQMDKLDEELRLAAKVQAESLPARLPRVGNVEVNVMFRPASYVSGDVYDVQRLDERHVGLWIADVVGHGVPAALMTMFLKAALPVKEVEADSYRLVPPDEALRRLNHEMVSRSVGISRFATACYIVVNCEDLTARVARAGHPHPMLLRADGTMRELDPEGPLLGVFEDEDFDLMNVQLEPGDRLVLHSDGFETAFAQGDKHHIDRYKREFELLRDGTCADALARLETLVHSQPGSLHQVDDLTVIMLGISPTHDAHTTNASLQLSHGV